MRTIIDYIQDADPTMLRALFGVVLLYCLVGIPLVILRSKSRRY